VPARARRDPATSLRQAVAAQGATLVAALAAAPPDAPVRDGTSVAELDRRLGTGLGRVLMVDADHLAAALSALPVAGALPQDPLLDQLVDLVTAALDLPEPVSPDRGALRLVVKALAERLASAAPGRHVEARIPPYAAVQCVEGPRHTRGTPPNVVEVDPVAFVELCTGRLDWAQAVTDGRVRTWGDRADLSPWLPLA
jgi:hypothetical protein